MRLAIRELRHIDEIGMEIHSKEVYFPDYIDLVVKVNEFTFEKFILSGKCNSISSELLEYETKLGIKFIIKLVSEIGN